MKQLNKYKAKSNQHLVYFLIEEFSFLIQDMLRLSVLLLISFHVYLRVHTCPLLIAPQSGSILGQCSNSSANDTCEHSCESGYALKGERILTCLSASQWDFPVPSCQRITCKDVVNDGYVTIEGDSFPGLANRRRRHLGQGSAEMPNTGPTC